MDDQTESHVSGPDFNSVEQISRRLGKLKRKKRELARANFPNPDALQELQEKINALAREKARLQEEMREEIRGSFGREDRKSIEAPLPPFRVAFCTGSGRRIDSAFARSGKIKIFCFEDGRLVPEAEITRPRGSKKDDSLPRGLVGVQVLFAKRITATESAALASAGVLAIATREGDFNSAIADHADQIRFFLENC